jgi:hypothetical protein
MPSPLSLSAPFSRSFPAPDCTQSAAAAAFAPFYRQLDQYFPTSVPASFSSTTALAAMASAHAFPFTPLVSPTTGVTSATTTSVSASPMKPGILVTGIGILLPRGNPQLFSSSFLFLPFFFFSFFVVMIGCDVCLCVTFCLALISSLHYLGCTGGTTPSGPTMLSAFSSPMKPTVPHPSPTSSQHPLSLARHPSSATTATLAATSATSATTEAGGSAFATAVTGGDVHMSDGLERVELVRQGSSSTS